MGEGREDEEGRADHDRKHAEVEEGRARQMHVADDRQCRVRGMRCQEGIAERNRAEAGRRREQQSKGEPARR